MHDILFDVLRKLGVAGTRIEAMKVDPDGNSSWRIDDNRGATLALRRYHSSATVEDLAYEHRVLLHAAADGWAVPRPVSELIEADGRLFCVTEFVPGSAVQDETASEQQRRGRNLARLHLSLRTLSLGQRPGWRSQHEGPTVHTDVDWEDCVAALRAIDPALADWAALAADATRAELAEVGAGSLPVLVVHGDFASWNVHYGTDDHLAGVVDFGLTHLDSRPYELAIARTYRAPAMVAAYRADLERLGWPLTEVEERAIEPMQRAFRVDMAAWSMWSGSRTGKFDLETIRRQLARTGTDTTP